MPLVADHPNPYTLQEAFDVVWKWFVIDKHPHCQKGGISGMCAYRDVPDAPEKATNACFAGCLIPDSLYNQSFESRTIDSLLSPDISWAPAVVHVVPAFKHLFSQIDSGTLHILQQIHDSFNKNKPIETVGEAAQPERNWDEYVHTELTKFATKYGLIVLH